MEKGQRLNDMIPSIILPKLSTRHGQGIEYMFQTLIEAYLNKNFYKLLVKIDRKQWQKPCHEAYTPDP